ncbi:pirin-like C-terminal cupin domain-containing protein [Achromobacter seleniivolatilans]|uniref:Pirin-like C-terminal cupin domain-containing protein n=1 Tax=Achromobacter seleniivolatilans TaxID=3047478 RepID=A0ABY9MDN7_9BURK|nr:pirin-like C-terminal cupin domain-containing protein [Achromobacter sp. R39]WMD23882.1 pirin-like C-terminal cupin domain-containing protein [Achromobacter sp. R39]
MGETCSIRQFRHTDFSRSMSPLVMVDHFLMTGPTFAPHPHAGMSAVTLLLEDSKGVMQSRDSVQNDHEIRPGDVHWTLAGKGILHTQQPVGPAQLNGLQIFVNLPERLKSLPPATSLLRAWEMPVIQTDAGRIRVVAGSYGGWQSPLETPEPLLMLDGWLRPGATQLVPLQPGWNAWIYAVQGDMGVRARHRVTGAAPLPKMAGGDPDFAVLPANSALVASARRGGDEGVLLLMAGRAPAHFVLIAGPAIDEPIVQRGPFVMSSQRALSQALTAYEAGEFGELRQDLAA